MDDLLYVKHVFVETTISCYVKTNVFTHEYVNESTIKKNNKQTPNIEMISYNR